MEMNITSQDLDELPEFFGWNSWKRLPVFFRRNVTGVFQLSELGDRAKQVEEPNVRSHPEQLIMSIAV